MTSRSSTRANRLFSSTSSFFFLVFFFFADHIQGEILLPDLLRLPPVGKLHPGAARLPAAVLGPAAGLPDLRALEADLHGNHRRDAAASTVSWEHEAVAAGANF